MTEVAVEYKTNATHDHTASTPLILNVQLTVQHGNSDNRLQFRPERKTSGSAGYDVRADIPRRLMIWPGSRELVPLGFCAAIPEGFYAQMSIRSGIALNRGLMLANGVAVIDSDYRGEWKAIITNISMELATINPGERIAQFVIKRYEPMPVEMVPNLETTGRDHGGFGSTGVD